MKKIFISLITITLSLALTSCGSSSSSSSKSTSSSSQSSSSSSQSQEKATTPTDETAMKITHAQRNDSQFVGKKVYAIGILNHASRGNGTILFNENEYSWFATDIIKYEDNVSDGDVVFIEGDFYCEEQDFLNGIGYITNATVKAVTATESKAFLAEREKLKDENPYVYNSECLYDFDYETLLRGGNEYKGKDLTFTGTIKQIIYGTDLMSSVANSVSGGAYCNIILEMQNDEIIVGTYTFKEDEDRFLEGDYVNMSGKFRGVEQLQTVLGVPKTYPAIDVKHISWFSP